ncbi:MAG: N-acetyltransferase family protein [Candidatus Thorarchaeota archaeon SMTZ1-45]
MNSINPSLEIRCADEEDAEQISALYKRVWDEFKSDFPEKLLQSRQPSKMEMIQWIQQDTYLVVVFRNSIIGVVGCKLEHGACLLTHMAVDKNHRRMGVGTALVEKVIEYAKENDSFKVWLDTAPFMSDAISLYERFGFKKSGYLQRHFWGLDVALYELVLKPQDHGDNDSM